jgi:hypothetical protein
MKAAANSDIMESVILKGDLARLTPDERVRYYNEVCRSLGLNPLTQPFAYMKLSGKETLYATRACADQLRKINGISLEIVSRDVSDDILTVHVRARFPDGRTDEDLGAVSFPSTLRGEARANAELKAVTKAKRRATLSACGLGYLDETEVDSIPGARIAPKPAPLKMAKLAEAAPPKPDFVHFAPGSSLTYDRETGEVTDTNEPVREDDAPAAPPESPSAPSGLAYAEGHLSDDILSFEDMAREAAMRGQAVFSKFYKSRNDAEKITLNQMGDELRGLMSGATG